jgi:glycopeptide antibiotics resistance protein
MKLWKLWILVVVVVSAPWFGVVRHPQWTRVTWIPFTGEEDRPRDVAANFLLYVPFGLSLAHDRGARHGVAAAALAALAVSLPVETSQLFFRLRDPSATDLLMAVCGSAAGSLAAQAFDWRHASGAHRRAAAGERGSQ